MFSSGFKHPKNYQSLRSFLENIVHNRPRGKSIWPAGVEGQIRDDLTGLLLRQSVVHRPVEVIRDLRDVAESNQGANGELFYIRWALRLRVVVELRKLR